MVFCAGSCLGELAHLVPAFWEVLGGCIVFLSCLRKLFVTADSCIVTDACEATWDVVAQSGDAVLGGEG